jgi:acylphosphatase
MGKVNVEELERRLMKRLHAIVRGIVQGVSFRYYTEKKAKELGLVGWVRNRADESVEVVAEGEEDALNSLKAWLHRGSPDAKVESVEASWDEPSGEFTSFKTTYGLD